MEEPLRSAKYAHLIATSTQPLRYPVFNGQTSSSLTGQTSGLPLGQLSTDQGESLAIALRAANRYT